MVKYFSEMGFQERSELIGLLGTSIAHSTYLVKKYFHPKFDSEAYMLKKVSQLTFRAIRNDKKAREKLEDLADFFKRYIQFKAKVEKTRNQEILEIKSGIEEKITKYNHALIVTNFE